MGLLEETDSQDPDPYEEVQKFPYVVSRLPEGVKITTSEMKITGPEITCLMLMLLLLLYSVIRFFVIWKRDYRMPDGVFYFEEKTVQTTNTREFKETNVRVSNSNNISAPRFETKISMNFVPWDQSMDVDTEQTDTPVRLMTLSP